MKARKATKGSFFRCFGGRKCSEGEPLPTEKPPKEASFVVLVAAAARAPHIKMPWGVYKGVFLW